MYECLACMHVCASCELELQMVVSHHVRFWETESPSAARAASALIC